MTTSHNILSYVDKNKQISDRIASAQLRLYDKLVHFDVRSSGISEYNQKYLSRRISKVKNILQLYSRLLDLCFNQSSISPENFVLVDYGGGHGLISLLAKEMGIGTVIYNDIYNVSCADVKRLSSSFELALDHIVCGDADELISYLHRNSLLINAIVSFDVLEHIYDVKRHFRELSSLSDNKFRVVHASSANIQNPLTTYSLKKKQLEAEYRNREKKWGLKERDSLRAYFDVRKDMISAYAPDLSSEEVEKLTRLTRGLMQRDIEKCIDEYRRKGSITYRPEHPFNTCDPYTGNWCEHLIEFGGLVQMLKGEGFSAEILSGSYNTDRSLLKRNTKLLLNTIMQHLGEHAMHIAPYYVVYADFPAEQGAASGR